MYSYNFLITIKIIYGKFCIKFSSILTLPKNLSTLQKNIFFFLNIFFSEKLKISVVYK
ncbi:hypothetical protein FWK35_00026783 [Aphis craccivora]|uniref:Uncharacterized protein n=1 Tax=Aphis craccivora TaxID=307492 RepID=A0A6G0YN10_APHCR|nr:hypothetical protein FWK35_00026783 [Aphis craccivora]